LAQVTTGPAAAAPPRNCLRAKRRRLEGRLLLERSHAPTVTYWRRELQRINEELERLQAIIAEE